ncbi:Bug family tripartite tricarboxylate transporter substrate binding protein [Roseomonas haemaphysalidis]|uniref:Tripartite tricarboxylate transporter substrate binding protein n=1 Tax=Roseomonas haemaphysalidis TaxID=2768162 RepID=A0ABS3KLD1_9PROT|nr:tripartite tricarboxylate transporter substrate binding protein [Roseomonas haemaphysalidis]MBO1078279.1 tripartite tricarboxylate transporter substrate binding protein [Roseomonas haemaphysalidis]
MQDDPTGAPPLRRRALLAGLGALPLAGTAAARAQAPAYPARAVTIIVPFAPGGSTDFVARLLAQHLSARLSGNFVVENRAGGSGTLGHGAVARARPDGYTLGVSPTGTFALAPFLFEKLPYDSDKGFAPISLLAGNAMFVCVHASSDIKSYAELIAAAKAQPGKLTYASAGAGTIAHLAPELMLDMSGTQMLHVAYRSGGLQVQAVLGREANLGFIDTVTAIPFIQSGDLRALAVTSAARSPQMPQVPTLAECGLAGYRATNDFGFFAPAGTPPGIVRQLSDAARDVLAMPDVKARLDAAAIDIYAGSAEAFPAYQADEARRWGDLIRRRDIKME